MKGRFVGVRGGSTYRRERLRGRYGTVPAVGPMPAMALLAVLTYPSDTNKSDELIEVLKLAYARKLARDTGRWTELPAALRDYRDERLDAALRKVRETWNKKRVPALEMAKALWVGRYQAGHEIPHDDISGAYLAGVSGLQMDNGVRTIADAARWTRQPGSPQNVTAKIWNPARPIIHLIQATAKYRPEGSVLDSIVNPDWAVAAIRHARYPLLAFYRENPQLLDIEADEFIDIEVAE